MTKHIIYILLICFSNLPVAIATEKDVIINYSIEYEDGTSADIPMRFNLIKINDKVLSDKDILDFASVKYSKSDFIHTRIILGDHNGENVVVEHPCSDLCPVYTVRIIRYDVSLNRCEEVKGKIREILVPVGIAAAQIKFCVPAVLDSNWDSYVR